MSDEVLKRDQNFVTVLGGVTDDADEEVKMLRVDPITKRLLVKATGSGIGTVTSISGGTGILLTPNPITTTGSVSLATSLQPIASLSGNSLKFLRVNAGETAVEYTTLSPGGSNTQIQFNDSGSFGGTSLLWNKVKGAIINDLPFTDGASHLVYVQDSTTLNTPGDALTIRSGSGDGAGAGGSVTVQGGNRGLSGSGGDVILFPGQGDNATNDGHVTLNNPTSGLGAIFDTSSIASSSKTYTFPNATGGIGVTTFSNTWSAMQIFTGSTSVSNANTFIGARYSKFGNASPNNTILSAGTNPGVELWGTDNTVGGVTMGTGNTSNGTSAYTGFFLNSDLAVSNDFTHFGGLFLNSSTYSDTTYGTAIAVPNLLQLQNTDGPIAYAAVNNSGAHIFYVGNTMSGGFATVGTGNEVLRINITGLGVHTTTPLTGLEVAETNTNAVRGILTGQYSTGTSSSRILLRKARGTLTVPTTVVTGDNIGNMVFEAYDGSNYLQMAAFLASVEGTVAATRVPTNIRIQTATNATPSVLTTAVTIDSAQLVTFAAGYTGRKVPRVTTAADATSITPNTNTADWTYQANTQATGTLTINADSGTPNNTQAWGLKIKSTNVQTFSWNSVFAGGAVPLPGTTSGGGVIDYYTFIWDSVNSRWHFTGQALSLST